MIHLITWLSSIKEHLCALSTMIPLVAHHVHSVGFSSIKRIFKRLFICKQIWIHCKHQKSLECMAAILKETLNLQMKNAFSKRRETENNMQVCFNILVLHRKLWYCFSKEVNLCCSMLLIPKNCRILTEIENIINESIWPFFENSRK